MSTKQVVVVRKDLKVRRGKEIAQGGHGFSNWLLELIIDSFQKNKPIYLNEAQKAWINGNIAKVVLQAENEEQLELVYSEAKKFGLYAHMVIDSGLTEFNGIPTKTVVAIGPDYVDRIDAITGPNGKIPLKLY